MTVEFKSMQAVRFLEPAQISKPFPPAPIDCLNLPKPRGEHAVGDATTAVFFGEDQRFSLTTVFREGIEHAMEQLNHRPRSLAFRSI